MPRHNIVFTIFLARVYLVSYGIVRHQNTFLVERDACPTAGCKEVRFPGDGAYMLFAPIYLVDKYANGTGANFVVIREG